MTSEATSARSLLKQAQDRSLQHRRLLAAAMTDVLVGRETVLSERERTLMSGILGKLTGEVEAALSRALAERLSGQDAALGHLLDDLAEGESEVARLVLSQSGLLADLELIEVVYHRALEQQLAATLRGPEGPGIRGPEGPGIRGPDEAAAGDPIAALLEHANAEIKEATKVYLVEEARRVDSYQDALLRRQDLGPELARRLVWRVAAALQTHVLESFEVDPAVLDEGLEQIAESLAADHDGTPAATPPAAALLAERLDDHEALSHELMIEVLRQGEVALFEALFGRLSGLAPPRLQRVLYGPGGLCLAIACRALDMAGADYEEIFGLVRRVRPGRTGAAPAGPNQAAETTPGDFERLAPAAAREVLAHWWRNPGYLDAIEAIEDGREG